MFKPDDKLYISTGNAFCDQVFENPALPNEKVLTINLTAN